MVLTIRVTFTPDLGVFTDSGKPPFAPVGVKVTRMVNTIAEGER